MHKSEKVFINGIARQPYTHYTIDYTNGTFPFVEPIPTGTPITVQFKIIDDQSPIKQTAEAYSVVSKIESRTPKQWSLTNRFYTISQILFL